MASTKLWMTAQTPSRSALPVCGRTIAFTASTQGTTVSSAAVSSAVVSVAAERQGVVAGDLAFGHAFIPGVLAWSPPTC